MNRSSLSLYAIAILGLCLAGCTSTTTLTKPTASTSLIDFTIALRAETSAGLDQAIAAIPPTNAADRISPDTKLSERDHQLIKRPTYSAMATWWCPRHKDVSSTEQVSQKFGEACRTRGGMWRRPYCEDAEGSPLFLAALLPSRYCSSGFVTAAVYVVEPTGSTNDSDYLRALKASQFPTRAEQEARVNWQQQQESNQQARIANSANRIRNEAQRGSRICSIVEGNITTVAHVLDKAPADRIEIRIHDVHSGTPGWRPSGGGKYGRPGDITFITPSGWEFCDQ